jgi:hypothetical protein
MFACKQLCGLVKYLSDDLLEGFSTGRTVRCFAGHYGNGVTFSVGRGSTMPCTLKPRLIYSRTSVLTPCPSHDLTYLLCLLNLIFHCHVINFTSKINVLGRGPAIKRTVVRPTGKIKGNKQLNYFVLQNI